MIGSKVHTTFELLAKHGPLFVSDAIVPLSLSSAFLMYFLELRVRRRQLVYTVHQLELGGRR